MSAYIVDREHIKYLVAAACALQTKHGGIKAHWFHNGEWHEAGVTDDARLAEVANMLWCENIKSVSARYPHESSATLPGPVDENFVFEPGDIDGFAVFNRFDPVQVIKSCDCYDYQSCEHDGWKTSEAKAFIDDLRSHAWHHLPGYEEAAWGAPETAHA